MLIRALIRLERPQSLSFLTAALVALAPSLVAIYGVMSYYVQQHVKGMILCGTLAALALTRFMSMRHD